MVSKIKDLFNTAKYRKKYNTILNKYETLLTYSSDPMVRALKERDSSKETLKKINKELDELAKRVSKLEEK